MEAATVKNKKTVVIGASADPGRYANMAVLRLKSKGHEVVPVGLHQGDIGGIKILTGQPEIKDVDTVTMYIRPELQPALYPYIFSLNPKRIIFNPGTENPDLKSRAEEKGIETIEACTLVLLSINAF